eukprot:1830483-Pyramimonas_sp.AAC.1
MAHPHPIGHTLHTFGGLVGSSTEGPSGRVRMAYPHPIRHTPHTFRGPIKEAPPQAPAVGSA